MPDWTKSMIQTFEYYTVDPKTWKDVKRLDNVISSSITRDAETETLGSASLSVIDSLDECYVRIYLVTVQNEITERFPLGTYLVQTPSSNFNGIIKNVELDAYTPLIELKENKPPIGYFVNKNSNTMDWVARLTRENLRAPVVDAHCDEILYSEFVANTDDTWMSFVSDLAANAKFKIGLDELNRVIFEPVQELDTLQPVWTYNDSNSSILYPDISMDQDLFGIPNVVEVICSYGEDFYYERVVNDDPNSPLSTVNRGREIVHRDTQPQITGNPTESQIKEYAKNLLKQLSSVVCTISYSHGYCPVRLGDCVRIDYEKAGLKNIKAKVISQTIKCEPGCPVSEKAVFMTKFWG